MAAGTAEAPLEKVMCRELGRPADGCERDFLDPGNENAA